MANITAKDVAELRKQTGVGMMDCKKALMEADGDTEKAVLILREKGLATQAKKAGRAAAEGIVTAVVKDGVGVVVEVNSETDFVAQNDQFKAFVDTVANTIIESNPADVDALLATKASGSDMTVKELYDELFLKIRENMSIRRFVRYEGVLVPYVHGGGSIGVMVKLDTDIAADNAEMLSAGKDCALQVAAMNPRYLDEASVPDSAIEEEKNIMLVQMNEDPKMASKPEQVKIKIVEGKIGKFYKENCLLDQTFVKDDKVSVKQYLDSVAKAQGGKLTVSDFVRFERGEGIEKKQDNFADEVASMMNK